MVDSKLDWKEEGGRMEKSLEERYCAVREGKKGRRGWHLP